MPYLTRQRLQTELELKLIRKRLKAEMDVEAQLEANDFSVRRSAGWKSDDVTM